MEENYFDEFDVEDDLVLLCYLLELRPSEVVLDC